MRGLVSVAAMVAVLSAAPAWAQQRGEFAASFNWAATEIEPLDNVEYQPAGFMAEGTWFLTDWFGVTGEFGYQTASGTLAAVGFVPFFGFFVVTTEYDVDTVTALGGARFRFPNDSIITPSARIAAGLGHLTVRLPVIDDSASDSSVALAIGGAVDIRITENLCARIQPDVIVLDHFDPVMTRLSFGISYSFGGGFAPRMQRQPSQPRRAAAGPPPTEQPGSEPAIAPAPVRIAAGPIPAGTAPPLQSNESARWTRLTGAGVGYEWSVEVHNSDLVAHTARATATLHDQDGNTLHTQQETGEVGPDGSITITGSGEIRRDLANRGAYWTVTVTWLVR